MDALLGQRLSEVLFQDAVLPRIVSKERLFVFAGERAVGPGARVGSGIKVKELMLPIPNAIMVKDLMLSFLIISNAFSMKVKYLMLPFVITLITLLLQNEKQVACFIYTPLSMNH